MSSPLATVGILSIGEMGMGIAKLLIASGYRVVTNVEGRSEDTKARALKAAIEPLPTDVSVVLASDYILSIVPPRDALSTAQRILTAFTSLSEPKPTPLYYLDLNAISPNSARQIGSLFSTSAPAIKFLDGGIIGGAPVLKTNSSSDADTKTTVSSHPEDSGHAWSRPSIPLSGPTALSDSPISGTHLASTLNTKHISTEIGTASGLKCCFASLTKGFTAICIQAFTTAEQLGVLELLKEEVGSRAPAMLKKAEAGVTGMPSKAYRWVREMEEIAEAHAMEGGWAGGSGSGSGSRNEKGNRREIKGERGLFDTVAEVYRVVAEETVLGEEKTERRKRGRTVDDVAQVVGEALRNKRRKDI